MSVVWCSGCGVQGLGHRGIGHGVEGIGRPPRGLVLVLLVTSQNRAQVMLVLPLIPAAIHPTRAATPPPSPSNMWGLGFRGGGAGD